MSTPKTSATFSKLLSFIRRLNKCRSTHAAFGTLSSFSCDDVFFTYSGSILRSEGFQRLSRDMMTRIIASDELRAEEMTVYERAVDWAKHHLEG